jgi:hypothetical protein
MKVRELDVVRVVVAGVVDEAVDGVDDNPRNTSISVRLHLHSVGSQDTNHPLNVSLIDR